MVSLSTQGPWAVGMSHLSAPILPFCDRVTPSLGHSCETSGHRVTWRLCENPAATSSFGAASESEISANAGICLETHSCRSLARSSHQWGGHCRPRAASADSRGPRGQSVTRSQPGPATNLTVVTGSSASARSPQVHQAGQENLLCPWGGGPILRPALRSTQKAEAPSLPGPKGRPFSASPA